MTEILNEEYGTATGKRIRVLTRHSPEEIPDSVFDQRMSEPNRLSEEFDEPIILMIYDLCQDMPKHERYRYCPFEPYDDG